MTTQAHMKLGMLRRAIEDTVTDYKYQELYYKAHRKPEIAYVWRNAWLKLEEATAKI